MRWRMVSTKAAEGLGFQTVGMSKAINLLGLLLGLELLVAGADRGLVEALRPP